MILCDPPFGITANQWDVVIPINKMFAEYDRIIKDNGAIVLFATQPFATDLINAYRKNDLIWLKEKGSDFLMAN